MSMGIIDKLLGLLEHPIKLAAMAAVVAFLSLLLQGTWLDLWNLKTEKWKLEKRYHETLTYNSSLEGKIEQARSSDKFIGRQAREKLDLVKEDELVFIFENETPTLETQENQH
jgi:cell division protein FtsB